MDHSDVLKKKLKKYKKEDITITDHAWVRAQFRNISEEEVKNNLINPEKLIYAEIQKAQYKGEKKYDCYFDYGRYRAHRYVIVINNNCVVCTIIDIRTDWQKIIEKKKKELKRRRY